MVTSTPVDLKSSFFVCSMISYTPGRTSNTAARGRFDCRGGTDCTLDDLAYAGMFQTRLAPTYRGSASAMEPRRTAVTCRLQLSSLRRGPRTRRSRRNQKLVEDGRTEHRHLLRSRGVFSTRKAMHDQPTPSKRGHPEGPWYI